MYTDYRMNDKNVKDYQKHERIIKTIKNRFLTYGYKRIKTSTFEQYDLYSKVNSSINQNEMIKVIDHTGQVLVLRPDVTIPITRQLAEDFSELSNGLRYFYVQDVFRQPLDIKESIENTQAGVEYFGESSVEADAEVIALACHTLKDLGFNEIKIEMGHAGFFQEFIDEIDLTPNELTELKSLIQAKNGVDISPFLNNLSIEKELIEAIEKIPFLYGNPTDVSKRAKELTLTKKMEEKLEHLSKVYEILKIYGLEDSIVMDLGLINQMGYYSDVIFQGFVEKFGKPVLMGGRYDHLGDQFGAVIPAIGFACKIDSLEKASGDPAESFNNSVDIKIVYDQVNLGKSIKIANELRELNYSVLSFTKDSESFNEQESTYTILITKDHQTIEYQGKPYNFSSRNELIKIIEGGI